MTRLFLRHVLLPVLFCMGFLPVGHAQVPRATEAYPPPYIVSKQLLDGVKLLPAPPADQSATSALDRAISEQALSLRGTPRWDLAISDADLSFPHAAGAFSCALGVKMTESTTPALYRLLRRGSSDAWAVTNQVKERYHRPRPLLVNGQPVCTPAERGHLTKSSSYPSNHSAIGWTWALILAEIAPERADAIFARGQAFGESRVVCNVHWQSDVTAGQRAGTAAVALMHTSPEFLTDLNTAKAEVAASRAEGSRPAGDCQAEERAIASRSPP